MITQRQRSLNKIRKAFEQGKLGFQKGAKNCLYYDKDTGSKCAVGVLFNTTESLKNNSGDIEKPFKGLDEFPTGAIGECMNAVGLTKFKGLTKVELELLQSKHDDLINYGAGSWRENEFKKYLYSLEA